MQPAVRTGQPADDYHRFDWFSPGRLRQLEVEVKVEPLNGDDKIGEMGWNPDQHLRESLLP
ncbi:MAG: hypothetical protein BroJett011_56140 [Chloroflexota bacterium]|nr:MAG: hypothetical protein BroJett011_56140 [Chloroflexota bacterium]